MAARLGDLERMVTVTVDVGPIKDAMQECVADLDRLDSAKASKDSVEALRKQMTGGFATTADLQAVNTLVEKLGAKLGGVETMFLDTKRKLASEEGKTAILEAALGRTEHQVASLAARMQTAENRGRGWDENGERIEALAKNMKALGIRIEDQEQAHARAMETISRLASMCDSHQAKLKGMERASRPQDFLSPWMIGVLRFSLRVLTALQTCLTLWQAPSKRWAVRWGNCNTKALRHVALLARVALLLRWWSRRSQSSQ